MKVNGIDLCIGCMRELDASGSCPHCHMNVKEYNPGPRCLLPGTELAGRYVLGKVLGSGNFGITYLAWDKILEVPIAIKEYYPADLVSRDIIRGSRLDIYADGDKDEYDARLKKFIKEARCLARFSNLDGIVSVQDFFYANNTAYLIMKYIEGPDVKSYVRENGRMEGGAVLRLMKPILSSLGKIHATGLLHRDISPDNILFQEEEKLVLIDFGSARAWDVTDEKSMTVLFKRGFSPEEQYRPRGRQGAWSDIYAICATMYYMLTGKEPLDAIERMAGEAIKPLSDMPDVNISEKAKEAIMTGMSVKAEDRYQNVSGLMEDLYDDGDAAIPPRRQAAKKAAVAAVCVIAAASISAAAGLHGKSGRGAGTAAASASPAVSPSATYAPAATASPPAQPANTVAANPPADAMDPAPPIENTAPPKGKKKNPKKTAKPKKTPRPKATGKPQKTERPVSTPVPTRMPEATKKPENEPKPKKSDGFIGIID